MVKFRFVYIIILFFLIISSQGNSSEPILNDNFRKLKKEEFEPKLHDTVVLNKLIRETVTNSAVLKQQFKYSDAILDLIEVTEYDSSASIFFSIAECYFALERYSSSRKYCFKSIEQDSTFLPAYELLLQTYYYERIDNGVLTVSEQILKLEPNKKNKIRYATLRGIDNPDESIRLLEELVEDSTDMNVLTILSSSYAEAKQFDKMSKIMEKIYSNQPSNYEIGMGLLEYYTDFNYFDKAFNILNNADKMYDSKQINMLYQTLGYKLISYEKSDSLNNFILTFLNRIDERFYFEWLIQAISGKLASIINDEQRTNQFYDRAFKLADTSSFLYLDAAISYSNLKNYDKSTQILIDGKSKFSDDLRFDFYLSNLYLQNKDLDKALEYSQNLINNDSQNIQFLVVHASVLQELKRYEESDKYYEKCLQIDPSDPSVNNNYAYSLSVRAINLNKALRLSKLSLESEPDNVAYLDTFGWIQFQLGNTDIALEYILKAVEKDGASSEVFEHLGDIYSKLNDLELAIESYNKALELDNTSKEIIEKIDKLRK